MNQQFIVYWLGYHQNPPKIQLLPKGIDVVNLFLLNLATSSGGTTLDYTYITSSGVSWTDILSQAQAARANGVKVCVSIIPPNATLIWNTIPDPTTFALNVYNLVTSWKLDGIDIDPEQGVGVIPNATFTKVVQALGKYFGPSSTTGLRMTFASYQLSSDKSLLSQTHALFDAVTLMGYFWSYNTMISQFKDYASVVGSENLLFGIGGDPWSTSYEETIQLAKWQPSAGSKGGMMEFNIDDDPSYKFANGIIGVIKPEGAA